jgi:hypothetical protein
MHEWEARLAFAKLGIIHMLSFILTDLTMTPPMLGEPTLGIPIAES